MQKYFPHFLISFLSKPLFELSKSSTDLQCFFHTCSRQNCLPFRNWRHPVCSTISILEKLEIFTSYWKDLFLARFFLFLLLAVAGSTMKAWYHKIIYVFERNCKRSINNLKLMFDSCRARVADLWACVWCGDGIPIHCR